MAPEIAVSVGAVLDGKTDIATGNVIGSNTFNMLGFVVPLTVVTLVAVVIRRPALASKD